MNWRPFFARPPPVFRLWFVKVIIPVFGMYDETLNSFKSQLHRAEFTQKIIQQTAAEMPNWLAKTIEKAEQEMTEETP
jgi:hypothetical protein